MLHGAVPTEVAAIYNNALMLSNRGEFGSALDEYQRAIKIMPNFIEAYNNIGELYSRMGRRDLAISSYMEALSIHRHFRILLNLGVEYYNIHDYKTALKYFSESVANRADFLEGNFYTGMAFFNLKDYAKSEMYFKRVVGLDEKHLKANYLLAYIYYEWKKYDRVLQCLERIKDTADDMVFLNKYYGFCFYHMGNFTEAVNYLSAALEHNPAYEKYRDYLAGMTYENKVREIGDIDAGILELERRMMKQRPTLNEYTRLSMLYIFKGQYKKAEALLEGARTK